ncbi:MAG: nuclear transport factor 2 family protein [Trueperaceae bacterium]
MLDSYVKPSYLRHTLKGFRETNFLRWTLEEYCTIFKGQPAPDESSRSRTIDSLDVSGKSAMAKATLVHGAMCSWRNVFMAQ